MEGPTDSSFTETLRQQGNASADRNLFVRFYTDEVEDEAATKAAGCPKFKSVEMVEIRIPGNRDESVDGRVKYMHPDPRKRFPEAYAKFKAGESSQIVGTLLRECGGLISRSRAKEFEHFNIYTVEQLAALSDVNAQNIRGSLEERNAAKDFLAQAAGRAPLTELRAEMAKLQSQLQVLQEQNEALRNAKQKGKG